MCGGILRGDIVTLYFARHQQQVTTAWHAGSVAPYWHQTWSRECQCTRFVTNIHLQGEVRLCKGMHEHWRLRGSYGGTSRTKLAEAYPFPLCSTLAAACCKKANWSKPNNSNVKNNSDNSNSENNSPKLDSLRCKQHH